MKKINFIKMEGTGNDFVVIDAIKTNLKKLAQRICDRQKGIGADGLLVCEKSKKADFKMRIINADGSEAEMCGNGARCFAAYAARTKGIKKKRFTLETMAGFVGAKVNNNQLIEVQLSNPTDYKPDLMISVNNRPMRVHYIDTGVPHVVIFVDDIDHIDVGSIGRFIRLHSKFAPRGTNVNFVEQIREDFIKVRTYERGVEGETRACGTGAVASAIIAFLQSNPTISTKNNIGIKVLTSGKEMLKISFNSQKKNISNVWLKGKINFVAKGVYYV